ncbi:hypothetical protein RFI_21314, partial [Reticulomyxa filosa]
KYPINVIDSDKNDAKQVIPKEYLCPLSNSIMDDPVIALNGITYDRSSIMNQYQSISNYYSLLIDGNLRLYPDYEYQIQYTNGLSIYPTSCILGKNNYKFFIFSYLKTFCNNSKIFKSAQKDVRCQI